MDDPLTLDTAAWETERDLKSGAIPAEHVAEATANLAKYNDRVAVEGRRRFSALEDQEAQRVSQLRGYFLKDDHGFTADQRQQFDVEFANSPTPEEDLAQTLNSQFFARLYGKDQKSMAAMYPLYQAGYAERELGNKNATAVQVFDHIKSSMELDNQLVQAASDSVLSGDTSIHSFAKWQVEVGQKQKGWNADKQADYWKHFQDSRDSYARSIEPYRSTIASTVDDLERLYHTDKAKPGDPATIVQLAQRIKAIPAYDRPLVMEAIGSLADLRGVDSKGVVQKVGESLGRGADNFISGAFYGAVKQMFGLSENMSAVDEAEAAAMKGTQPVGKEGARVKTDPQDLIDVVRDLQYAAESRLDPVKGNNWLTRGLYSAAYSVPYTLGASIPGIGWMAVYESMAMDNYDQLRRDHPEMEPSKALNIASFSSVLQTPMEMIEARFLLGKMPTTAALLNRAISSTGSKAIRFGVRWAEQTASEFITENAQDLTPEFIHDLANAFEKDSGGKIKLENTFKAIHDQFKGANQGDLFVSMGLLSIIGAGLGTWHDVKNSQELLSNRALLMPFLNDEAKVQKITELASAGKMDEAAALFNQQAAPRLKAGLTIEDAAKEALKSHLETQQVKAEAVKTLEQMGNVPVLARTNEGWRLTDGDASMDFATHAEADAARWKAVEDRGLQVHAATREAFAQMEQNAEVGREFAIEFSPEEMSGRRAVEEGLTTEEGAKERAKIGSVIDEDKDYTRASAEAAVLAQEADDVLAAHRVLGMSKVEFKEGVMRTTVRLFQGATPLTAIEEKLEGDAMKLMAEGKRDWMIQALRDYEAKSGDKLFVSGDDSKLTDNDVREAWSHLGQSYFVGRSRKGDASMLQSWKEKGFRKVFADVMRSKLGAAMSAYASFFRAVWRRASKLNKLRREGGLHAGLEMELARQLGLEQRVEDTHTMEEAQSLRNELATAEGMALDPDNAPFSLGPGELDARLAKLFDPFQKNPVMRARVVAEMKRRLGKLTDGFRDATGANRTVRSIEREASSREAFAADRLERDLTAKEMSPHEVAALEAEDESKFKNHPLVAAILGDVGKLMSQSQAAKLGKVEWQHGDYDAAPMLPPWMWGGNIMPDQAAQALFEKGLLKDAYPDTLWNALSSAMTTTAKLKAEHEAARQKMKDIRQRAREEAKLEVQVWRDSAMKASFSKGAERARMLAAMRSLNAIISALPAELRGKVGGYIDLASAANDETRLTIIEDRTQKASELLEKWLRKHYSEDIGKVFDSSKLEHEPGKKAKSKLGADAFSLIQSAKAATGMDGVAADAEIAKIQAIINGGTLSPEQEAVEVQRMELTRLFHDFKNADSARMEAALETLKFIRTDGYLKWKQHLIDQRAQREAMRGALRIDTGSEGAGAARVEQAKQAAKFFGKVKDFGLSLSSFAEVMRYVFGEKSATGTEFVDRERNASNQYEDEVQGAGDAVADLFTRLAGGSALRGEKLRYQMAQHSIKVDVPALAAFTGNFNELTPLQAIQFLLMWRQEDGKRHMEGPMDDNGKPAGPWHYDQAWVDEVEKRLTPEAVEVMKFLQTDYGREWSQLDPLYRERHGVSLPRNDRYAPLTVVPKASPSGMMVDPLTGADASGGVLTPGSLRTRNTNIVAEPRVEDALQTWLAHKKQMAHWKAYYELATDMQSVFGERELGNAVKASAGEEASKVLRRWKDAITMGGVRDAAAGLAANGFLNRMAGRAAAMALVGKVSVLAVQATQLAAASVKMPVGAYLLRFGKLFAGRLNWSDAIKSDFIQRRIEQAPPIVRQAMQELANASKPNFVKHWAAQVGKLISGADGLFTAGTYAILLDYHRSEGAKLGLSGADLDAYAHRTAERDTEAVAQPTRMANRSYFEVTATNPLSRLGWAFASENRQKLMLFAWAADEGRNRTGATGFLGKAASLLTDKNAAKTFFLTFVVGGLATQILRNAWKMAKGDDDDNTWSPGALTASMFVQPLTGIPGVDLLTGHSSLLSRGKHALDLFGGSDHDIHDVENLLWAFGLFNDTAAGVESFYNAGADFAKVLVNIFGH